MFRVLMVLTNLRVTNGVASFAMNYFRNLNFDEVEMDFAIYQDIPTPYYDEIKEKGSRIYILPSIKKIGQHLRFCNEILNNVKYDVIHNNTLHIAIPIMYSAILKKVPVRILHSHSAKLGFTKVKEMRNRLLLPLMKFASTHYVACSEVAGKGMFGNRQFYILHNVINSKKYSFDVSKRIQVRKQMGVQDCFVIGSVGRTAEEKNPFFAMNVFKIVAAQDPFARYWWIGSGPLDEQLADYVKRIGIEDKVSFLGSRNDVVDLYQAMDCLLFPSVAEGLGLVGVEAQAMGLPCVMSDAIPNEVGYTSNAVYISLGKSIDEWAERILLTKGNVRKGYSKELAESVYCDNNAGDIMTSLYIDMFKNT